MRIKIVKCEARNTVSIGNIDKFRALRDCASFPEEVPLGCNETRHQGGGKATSGTVAELVILNS